MRVSIDATPLLLRSAGVKNYIYHWLTHLRRLAGPEAVRTFPFFTRIGKLDHEHSMAGPLSTAASLFMLHGLNVSQVSWSLPSVDIFHLSHHCQNPPRGPRLTTTMHDMTCWLMPELHATANVRFTTWFAEHMLPRMDGILAVSESTKRDLSSVLNVRSERVEVIYPGIPDEFFDVTATQVHAARKKHSLSRPYVLFVGTIEPRKNLPRLVEAYQSMTTSTRQEFELVVAGPVGWADHASVAKIRSAAGVRCLGYVDERDLPGLTAGATVMAYPSLYEGFGFPVAQAMAAGVPVMTSDVSSLPEVTGDAGLLIDPESPFEMSHTLERLLTSPELRARLGGAGRRRAQQFRWDISARKSLDWFQRITGK